MKGVRGLHFQQSSIRSAAGSALCAELCLMSLLILEVIHRPTANGMVLPVGREQEAVSHPGRFAHGFLVLSDEAEFCYKVNDFWHPNDEGGMAWNDSGNRH